MISQQSQKNDEILEEIVSQFVSNYLSISNLSYSTNQPPSKEWLRQVLIDIPKNCDFSEVRNVIVLGAGASFDCYPSIPMAEVAKEKIKQNLGVSELSINEAFLKKVEEHKKRLQDLHSVNPEEFESELAILSNFITTEDILHQLSLLYNKRLYPSLFYEIVAHLFKHRFIDAIINFNFDELLDQAIEEEMSYDDYHYIYSDGQCMPMADILVNGRLKLPLYIKPHGTISQKSSLKFTKEAYFGMSDAMKNQLTEVISGTRTNEYDRLTRVNLIVIGNSLKSLEFNEILGEHLPEHSAIYYFATKLPEQDYLNKKNTEDTRNKFGEKFDKCCGWDGENFKRYYHINADTGEHNIMGKCFQKLYDTFMRKKIFRQLYEPKDIYRHLLINDIFYNEKTGQRLFANPKIVQQANDRAYLLMRMMLELIIAFCKAKFTISMDELMQERFGKYYKLYCKKSREMLMIPLRVHEILELLGLEYSNIENSIIKKGINDASKSALLKQVRNEKEKTISDLLKCLSNLCKERGFTEVKDILATKQKEIENKLLSIYQHESLSISPKFEDMKFYTFRHMTEDKVIPTKLALLNRFLSGYNKDKSKWDILLVLSNKAKILLNLLNNEENTEYYANKQCLVLIEDPIYKKELEKLIKEERLLGEKLYILENNKKADNIILFMRHDASTLKWAFVKGIMYHRINGSFKICPYFIDAEYDLKELGNQFFREFKTVATEEIQKAEKDTGKKISCLEEYLQYIYVKNK